MAKQTLPPSHDNTMREVGRFFHEKGLEPQIFWDKGEIEIVLASDQDLEELLVGLDEHLTHAFEEDASASTDTP